jgi:DnaJ-class molecular chaperone
MIRWPRDCRKCHGSGCRRQKCDECTPYTRRFGGYCPACHNTGEVLVECEECEGEGLLRPGTVPRIDSVG